ncbi:MAG TPA: tetratricopeptide repeat protein [Usitatibacter sp.]|nr:tetratricopeptide repeat protein [Usitatibacter sp.]
MERRGRGDIAGAEALVQSVLAESPRLAEAWNDHGLLRLDRHDVDGARDAFLRAVELSPDFAQAHFNLSLVYLMRGDYERGFREYEWRTRAPGYADYANYPFGMPRWRGESLAGKRLLVHGEQGQGDVFQMIRFVPRIAAQGGAVDVFCMEPLVPILATVPGVGEAFAELAHRPTHDFHAPIFDLAAHFLTGKDPAPWHKPYIAALPGRAAFWATELAALPRPRVGLVWRGSAKFKADWNRSLDPAAAARLLVPGVSFVGLQVPQAPMTPPEDASFLDLSPRIRDWNDTAAIIENLDLVVSVDSAVAHLAGAMGRPVWTLIAHGPEWRWGLSGTTTRWYPSMRLFRQAVLGDWRPTLEEVRANLAGLAA